MFHPQGPSFWELARQALSSTEHGYDLLAPKFEYTPFRTPDAVIEPAVASLLADRGCHSALDICCGTGAAMAQLRPYCRERVVGIDFSKGMLEQAHKLVHRAEGPAHIELVKGDVLEMDFRQEFDLAVCFGALGHILPRDEDRFVDNIYRALRPGGRFAVATGYSPPPRSRAYVLSKLFNTAMRVRNALIRPRFIMYYLTFLLPNAQHLLQRHGFTTEIREGLFPAPYSSFKLLVATKR
ncbi:MAG: class I SAM-dependent methyltransferase [Acidobacteriota bacterium]|nr:class I SAM-dependent methyltransferase [Acidobacteriota bacterium]